MASQGATLHVEYEEQSAMNGYAIRRAGTAGIITNAQVIAATSAEDLEVIVEAGLPGTVHDEYSVEQINTDRALKFGDALGDFSDSRVAAATGYESLAEQTNAADESDLSHLGPQLF